MFLTLVSAGWAHLLNASVSQTPESTHKHKRNNFKIGDLQSVEGQKNWLVWLLQLRRDRTGLKEIFELVH
jgi:hypothetical protein